MISAVLVALFAWWFDAGLMMTVAYAVLAVVATLTVPIIYRFAGFTLEDELEWLENREAKEHEEMIGRLRESRRQLEALDIEEGVRQADMLTGILDDYHSVVETRFIGKKNSPLAYLASARTVQKHAVQNLTDVVAIGHSMSTIDRNRYAGNTEARADQQNTMYADQSGRLDTLLEENRKMFDALTDTAVEVANIKSFSKFERIDTLGRLVSLAEIASKTNH